MCLSLCFSAKSLDLRPAHHGAVVVDEFADHADRLEVREAAQIDRGLGMAGAHQHAAVLGDEWKDVAGAREVRGTRIVIGKTAHGRDTILRGNTGGGSMLVVDRYGERGAMRRVVVGDHRREPQPVRGRGGQRRAHDAAGVTDDECHLLRRRMHGGEHQVALVLAIVVVGDDHDLAAAEGFDSLCDALLGVGHQTIDPLLGRHEPDEVIRRDGAARRLGDAFGKIERGKVALANLGDAAGRNLDLPRKVRAGRFRLLQPLGKLHRGTLAWLKFLGNGLECLRN